MDDKQRRNQKTRILVIAGPTASGKSDLGIYLAKRLQGEILSADSMQIYQELSIGTAKPTPEQIKEVAHHLVDCVPLDQPFSVADYLAMATQAIEEIVQHQKLPIVVGGTGQYIDALLHGISFFPESNHAQVRKTLQSELKSNGKEALWRKLFQVDPAYARTLHYQNVKRVLRGIEFYQTTGMTMSEQLQKNQPEESSVYDPLMIGLGWRDRSILYDRIEQRIDQMCNAGLLEEARRVYEDRRSLCTVRQAIGYKEFFPYFEGEMSLEEAIAFLKQQTRRYAKRQLTWFRRNPQIHWYYLDDCDNIRTIYEQIRLFIEKTWNL